MEAHRRQTLIERGNLIVLAGTNTLFNLYPILLQRYARARLALIIGRSAM